MKSPTILAADLDAVTRDRDVTEQERIRMRDERDALAAKLAKARKALGWFLNDSRFQVGVGGNPIVVDDMLARAFAILQEIDNG